MAATERQPSAPVRTFKRARVSRPPSHWERTAIGNRDDLPALQHWQKASAEPVDFTKYNVQPEIPKFDWDTYNSHLKYENWTYEDTSYLVNLYKDCSGRWPVIIDRCNLPDRSMEDLKTRFYRVSATLLQLATPISSMTAPEYKMYETLNNFNPQQELSRKRLAEGHLQRRQDEVDEEAVLLAELQRIMANQASLDESREELRKRLDFPKSSSNSYQYGTSQALGALWQQLISADRLRKNQRMRQPGGTSTASTENPGTGQTPTSARPRESNAGSVQPDAAAANTTDLSAKEKLRFGVVQVSGGEKMPNGISFASDRVSKLRNAKSTIQNEKIAAILTHVGVPEIIPLPTPAVVESFEGLMAKVHMLLDMRKLAEKEEQELKVREAEAGIVQD